MTLTLDQLPAGQSGTITKVGGKGGIRQRLLDMGLIPNTSVMLKKAAPMGDPIEITIRGYELSLRLSDARHVEIRRLILKPPKE